MGVVYAMNRENGALIWETEVGTQWQVTSWRAYPTAGTVTLLPGILGG